MRTLEQFGADAARYREAERAGAGLELGRIAAQSRRGYRLLTDRGEFHAEVTGRFRHGTRCAADFPAVGDFVLASVQRAASRAAIHGLLERRSCFERTVTAGGGSRQQVVAANIDVVFICMSLNANFNPSRLERYLSVGWRSGARPVVVLTKADLPGETAAMAETARGLAGGADVLLTTVEDLGSCRRLLPYVPCGATAAFIGSSGVGKSTLINCLLGEERQATAAVREGDDKGRHTTSMREMFAVPGGGAVIDTPGMRELGTDEADLASSFADIEELALACRFSDCLHETEPGCAVKAAVEAGQLEERRLESYRKLRRESRGR